MIAIIPVVGLAASPFDTSLTLDNTPTTQTDSGYTSLFAPSSDNSLTLDPNLKPSANYKIDFSNLPNFFWSIRHILGLVPNILVAMGVIAFLWVVMTYIRAGSSEKMVKEGKDFMIYGIIGIFVMVSVWGLVTIMTSTFFPAGADGGGFNSLISRFKGTIKY